MKTGSSNKTTKQPAPTPTASFEFSDALHFFLNGCKGASPAPTKPTDETLPAFNLLLLTVLSALAQTKSLLNLDKDGAAIQGDDPVAFFTENKPVKGDAKFPARHNGAT